MQHIQPSVGSVPGAARRASRRELSAAPEREVGVQQGWVAVKGAEHDALAGVVVKLDRQRLVPGLGGGQVQRVVGPGPWLEDSDERLGKLHGVLRPLAELAAKSCTGCRFSELTGSVSCNKVRGKTTCKHGASSICLKQQDAWRGWQRWQY